jgi:hypothetical protein
MGKLFEVLRRVLVAKVYVGGIVFAGFVVSILLGGVKPVVSISRKRVCILKDRNDCWSKSCFE